MSDNDGGCLRRVGRDMMAEECGVWTLPDGVCRNILILSFTALLILLSHPTWLLLVFPQHHLVYLPKIKVEHSSFSYPPPDAHLHEV